MKILQIVQKPQLRGAEMFACQLSVALEKLGHEVHVLFLAEGNMKQLDFSLQQSHLQANLKYWWADVKTYRRMHAIIQKGKYDMVQANAGDTLKYAAVSKYLFGWQAKLVYRNASKMSLYIKSDMVQKLYHFFLKQVDAVASVSHNCKADFLQLFPRFNQPVKTLPIGVDFPLPVAYPSLAEAGIFLPDDAVVLLHVGGFTFEKNHQGLLRIFEQLRAGRPNLHLLLVGDGGAVQTVKALVEASPYRQSIHLLGKRHDVKQLMPLCHAFVLPSIIEGLPGVILEAFATGLPVIAYNTGGIGEVVLNGQTGKLVNLQDEAGFVEAVEHTLATNQAHTIKQAKALVTSEYSNAAIAQKFAQFYNTVIREAH